MLTKIEIDGFKTFENFSLSLTSFAAIVGPNASGKSNLFDALQLLAELSRSDVRSAMENLRGEAEELFRQISIDEKSNKMNFAIEVLLEPSGVDPFGQHYEVRHPRVRYEVELTLRYDSSGAPLGVFVTNERCAPIKHKDDSGIPKSWKKKISYGSKKASFIETNKESQSFFIRQDGPQRHGSPVRISLREARKTALSTVSTAEFPHVFALKEYLSSIRFLQIDPVAARRPSDRLAGRELASDASNLAAVLAKLKADTATVDRPDGALADIVADVSSLIPSIKGIVVRDDPTAREYSFEVVTVDRASFSSRVISDGTLRLLALLTLLNDPQRKGTLCFEEPENGIHGGRIPALVEYLRNSATNLDEIEETPYFQIIINTHSPVLMASLNIEEMVAADVVSVVDPQTGLRTRSTRMRPRPDMFVASELADALKAAGEGV